MSVGTDTTLMQQKLNCLKIALTDTSTSGRQASSLGETFRRFNFRCTNVLPILTDTFHRYRSYINGNIGVDTLFCTHDLNIAFLSNKNSKILENEKRKGKKKGYRKGWNFKSRKIIRKRTKITVSRVGWIKRNSFRNFRRGSFSRIQGLFCNTQKVPGHIYNFKQRPLPNFCIPLLQSSLVLHI